MSRNYVPKQGQPLVKGDAKRCIALTDAMHIHFWYEK